MFTSFKRVLQFAFKDFYRNKGLSLAAIFVLTVTVLLVTGLFFLRGMSNYVILQVENKIDITAYFKADTAESDILNVKNEILQSSPDIKSVQYVSEQDALNDFTQKHGNDPIFTQALTEVGDNPFLPSLNITTTGSPLEYQQVATVLESDQFSNLIDSVDFSQKQDTINKVFSITQDITYFGWGLAIILMLIVVAVVFNTVKLIIDRSREEIATMRVVGASSWFVKAPYLIQGAIFGAISFLLCFVVTAILSLSLSHGVSLIVTGFSLFDYFVANIWLILLLQLGFSVGLGVISSFIVVNKYLRV